MKLHLGCGKRFIPGYYHIDVMEYDHIDLRHAVDSLPMVASASADVIYACHVLEHFQQREVYRVLTEWRRILRPGGTLRLAVPDFEAAVMLYQTTGKVSSVRGLLFGRGDFLYNVHYNVYDLASLEHVLRESDFKNIHRYDWRKTEHANVDDYSQAYFPHMAHRPDGELVGESKDVEGILLSLNVEATK